MQIIIQKLERGRGWTEKWEKQIVGEISTENYCGRPRELAVTMIILTGDEVCMVYFFWGVVEYDDDELRIASSSERVRGDGEQQESAWDFLRISVEIPKNLIQVLGNDFHSALALRSQLVFSSHAQQC